MKQAVATSIRGVAHRTDQVLPELGVGDHLRDAANSMHRGKTESAGRHLAAAMHTLAPLSLYRHGITDDDGHAHAKRHMDMINRHCLLIKDIEDAEASNQAYRDQQAAARADVKGSGIRPGAAGDQPGGFDIANLNGTGTGQQDYSIELAFHPDQLRGPDGKWVLGPGGHSSFSYSGAPGGFSHIRAIEGVGDKYQPQGELRNNASPGPAAEMLRTSMRAAARFTAMRKMGHARKALDSAEWAARHTSPLAVQDVRAVRASLAGVPAGVGTMTHDYRVTGPGMTAPYSMAAYTQAPPPQGYSTISSQALEMSADTARLAVTPAPIGQPGGPGAYHVKGMEFPPYFQNVRNALIRAGHSEGSATAITWGSVRKWAAGSGNVHPEVRAAAVKALAGLAAMSARAHAQGSSHSNGWNESINLAGFNPAEPRTAGGTWGAGGAAPAGGSKQVKKRKLLSRAKADRQKANALSIVLKGLEAQLRAQHAAHTKQHTTGSKKTTAAAARKAATSKKTTAASAKKAVTRAASKTTKASATANLTSRILAVRKQISQLRTQAAQLTFAASKL
jgi:hypothetical protein